MGSHAPTLVQAETHPNKVQPKHPVSVQILENKIPKSLGKLPKLTNYDGKGDLDTHATCRRMVELLQH